MTEKTLASLQKDEVGIVTEVLSAGTMKRRFYDIGCVKGAEIRLLGTSPLGDPRAYAVCGAVIAIRKQDAEKIRIRVEHI